MTESSSSADNADARADCKHHEVCGRTEYAPGTGVCILHDPAEDRDRDAFYAALAEHRAMLRERREQAKAEKADDYEPRWDLRDDFRHIVFPDRMSFEGETFPEEGVDFSYAIFGDGAIFRGTTFGKDTDFTGAIFRDMSDFRDATFDRGGDFGSATFGGWTVFLNATFGDGVSFLSTTFGESVHFLNATFGDMADFRLATFGDRFLFYLSSSNSPIFFSSARFEGQTEFRGMERRLFSRDVDRATKVLFDNVMFRSPSEVAFRNVDLSQARFLHTDVREVEFTDVTWAKIESGDGVYDEVKAGKSEGPFPYGALARLYRRLKQTYEEDRDFGRGGDFHFREKEMMRRNPDTSTRQRVVLYLYRLFSGYGERYWAGVWFLSLILACSLLSLVSGLTLGAEYTLDGAEQVLRWRLDDFFWSFLYSVQVAFVRPPANMAPTGVGGEAVRVVTMILGPIFLGLFALAVRQRVRR